MDFGIEVKNRFVCPNDRQLALRAKLRTGWSVKTHSLGYQQTDLQPIGNDEQATIIEVIRRAEQLDKTEQERVGRLVDRLENMRRNTLGKNPTQCLLCGDHFGVLGAQKLRCVDCKHLVCHKCSIENCQGRNGGSSAKESHLCIICAESREVWKKSGAWFFKSIPKYILPGQRNFSISKRGNGGRKSRIASSLREEDSSSDEDRRWKFPERRNSSTESAQDTVEGQAVGGEAQSCSRQTSSSDSQVSKELEPLKAYMSNLTLEESYSEVFRTDSISGDASDFFRNSRRESLASRSLSEYGICDDRISPSTSSLSSSIFKNPINENKPMDTSLGIMELSLTYDPLTSTLHCTVYRAKNLIPMDINGLADPFCKLNILPSQKVSARLRTKTVHKTRNPEFNENLTFYEITRSDLAAKNLHVLVVDDDRYGHDYMGEVRVGLAKLAVQNTVYHTLPLEKLHPDRKGPNPGPDLNEWFDDLWSRGQILLSLCYSTKKRALLVTIVKCANLLPMDNNGFSDPFVKLHLRPDPYHRKHKTSIKWKNLNPVYNEEFAFESRPTELSSQSLHLAVWDKDYGKSNDYLGGLVVGGQGSKGQRLKHWLDMIRYPDHRHEYWHNLTEDQIND